MSDSIYKPVFNPVYKAVYAALYDVDGSTTRYFTDLDGVGGHYVLASSILFNGNLKISYVTTTTATEMDFADGFGITVGGLFKAPASITDVELNGVSVGLGFAAPLDGKLNTVEFIGAMGATETITMYGQSGSGTNYFKGKLSDPATKTFGAQLFTTFTSLDPGSTYIAGVLTLVQNSGQDFAISDVNITNGTSYTIDYNVTSENIDVAGELRITTDSGNTTRVLLPHTVGPHSEEFIADANYLLTLRLGNTGNGQIVIGDDWSVRKTDEIVPTTFLLNSAPGVTTENSVELNNSVTMIGITTTDTELYTLVDADWLGEELWVDLSIGAGWTDNNDGSYTLVGNGTLQVIKTTAATVGALYRVSWTVDSIDNGMKVQSAGGLFDFSATGDYVELLTATAVDMGFSRSGGNVVNATLSNTSVKQLITVA